MQVGEFVHVIADAHIYDRHISLIEELISRETHPAPKFWLNPEVKDFYQFTPDDVKIRRLCDRTADQKYSDRGLERRQIR